MLPVAYQKYIAYNPGAEMTIFEVKLIAIGALLPDLDYPLCSTIIRICQHEGFILDDSHGNSWNYTVRFIKPQV